MRFFLLILFLCISTIASFSQKRDSVIIENDVYKIIYSEVLEQPLKVTYIIKCSKGTVERSGINFYKEEGLHTSDNEDYQNNIWDKGHCAPAADFNCTKEMLNKTFSYVNCVLQDQRLNRGVWKSLEIHEREISETSMVTVEIEVFFSKKSIKLPTGATVPDGFQKNIYKNGSLIECYYFNNEMPKESNYLFYRINCKK